MKSRRHSWQIPLALLLIVTVTRSDITNETIADTRAEILKETSSGILNGTTENPYVTVEITSPVNSNVSEPNNFTTDRGTTTSTVDRANRENQTIGNNVDNSSSHETDAVNRTEVTVIGVSTTAIANVSQRQSTFTADPTLPSDVISDEDIAVARKVLICEDLGCECPEDGGDWTFLDCSGKRIRTLPDGIVLSAKTSGITFQKNDIRTVSTYSFADAPAIEELDLAENKIERIEDGAFQSFGSLAKLILSDNLLRKLPGGVLKGLHNLRVLDIGNNLLTELKSSIFEPAKDLQEVKMQKNKLNLLDGDAFKFLSKLEKLDLSGNGLKSLHPNLFDRTPLLRWLSLTDNAFRQVPAGSLSRAKNLHSLNLSGNRFSSLGRGAFSSLDGVSLLYLNNIQTLVRIEEFAFANMTNLRTLYITSNKRLGYIHAEAFSQSIDQLFLQENALKTLPEPRDGRGGIWSKLEHADLRMNPWICDCNMRWMKKAPQNIFSSVRCVSPLNMHGRSLPTIEEAELECYDDWMISSIILGLTSALVFATCSGFFFAMIYSRSSIRRYLAAKTQFMYAKVPPKTESVDLEWDPSADL